VAFCVGVGDRLRDELGHISSAGGGVASEIRKRPNSGVHSVNPSLKWLAFLLPRTVGCMCSVLDLSEADHAWGGIRLCRYSLHCYDRNRILGRCGSFASLRTVVPLLTDARRIATVLT